MLVYLIRHAETDPGRALDPFNHPLTPPGQTRAKRLAQLCEDWGIELLCVSMMQRSQQTADAISELLPDLERWDLEELEDLTTEDLLFEPTASHLISTWTPEQMSLGLSRLWIRVMPIVARVEINLAARNQQKVAIVANERVLSLLLLNWMGLDWQSFDKVRVQLDEGASCAVSVEDKGTTFLWLNR